MVRGRPTVQSQPNGMVEPAPQLEKHEDAKDGKVVLDYEPDLD